MDDMTVYVPAPGSLALQHIEPGSGIVGSADEDERVRVDYEGNLYHRPDLKRYANRVYQAACRHADGRQTVARDRVSAEEVVAVGVFDDFEGEVLLHAQHDQTLAEWLGIESVPEDELVVTALHYERRRQCRLLLASTNPVERMYGRLLQRRYGVQTVRRASGSSAGTPGT